MDLKQQVLAKSDELFMRYGIKSVSMDDIAKAIGISKKTLYQVVDNKVELIEQIFQRHKSEQIKVLEQIQAESIDAIDEILKIARYHIQELRSFSPTTIYDLRKYYKTIWKLMEGMRQEYIYKIIRSNLERGVKQGLYRKNLNPDIVAKLLVFNSSAVVDEEIFPPEAYKLETVFRETIKYHIHGIASAEGIRLMEKYEAAAPEKIG